MKLLNCLLFAAMTWVPYTHAQTNSSEAAVGEVLVGAGDAGTRDLRRFVLSHPATINPILQNILTTNHPLKRFFDVADFRLKGFDSDKSGADASIGVSYQIAKSIEPYYLTSETARHDALTVNFWSRGDIAFDSEANPRDFIEIKGSFLGFTSRGGAVKTTDEVRRKLNDLVDVAADAETPEQLEADPAAREAAAIIRSHLTTQYFAELGLDGGLEADQSFDRKQYTYGAHLALDIKAWNDDSPWARFNVLDWPFALIRKALEMEKPFKALGSSFPTFYVGIDQVMPTSDHPRAGVGEDDDFTRFRAEMSFRTPLFFVDGHGIFFETDLRYYQEISPSRAVRTADLDQSTVFTALLQFPKGIFISYSAGKTPFDVKDSSVFAAGFRYSL